MVKTRGLTRARTLEWVVNQFGNSAVYWDRGPLENTLVGVDQEFYFRDVDFQVL